jgi:preprotein translocase subunit SecD
MRKNMQWKALLIALVVIVFAWSTYPPKEKINLGLDLRGGIHLIMRVNTVDAVAAITNETVDAITTLLDGKSLSFESVSSEEPAKIRVSGVDVNQDQTFRELIETNFPSWDPTRPQPGVWELTMRAAELSLVEDETVAQAIETIRRRVDALGVAEPVIAPHGDRGDQILVQLPGFDDVARAKEIIRSTARLDLKLVEAGPVTSREQFLQGRTEPPEGTEIVPGASQTGAEDEVFYLVDRVPVITGRDLKNARQSIDFETNQPNVSFTLQPEGANKFRRATQANVGRQLAIILDGRIMSAPVIQSAIYDQGQITGQFTLEEAQDLALVLRSGALPASLEYQEERTVGPSLGADSIRSGIMASLVGFAAVVLAILFYYRLAGINAVVALVFNLVMLMGAMAYFGATLTLPGIAGVILTIGMGVDSNILIFERIKEELRGGKTPRTAISAGFGKVFWTIFDTHLTSLVAALILFQFGTGPVQGFAVTLSIGLLANVFTSVFVSRFIFDLVLGGRRQIETLSI